MKRCGGFALAAQIALLAGCGIESPELPTWQASYVVPILSESWDAAELFAELDTAFVQSEGDSSSLGIDLRLDLDPAPLADALTIGELEDTIRGGLDEIEIDVSFGDSASIYPFWELYSQLDPGDDPYFGIVPSFDFDHSATIEGPLGYDWIDLKSGSVFIEITNGLPVPVLDPAGSPQPRLLLETTIGEPIAEQIIDEVLAPSEIRSVEIDVAGERLEAQMRGRLVGTSAGSDSIVEIDPNAFVSVRIAEGEALHPEAFKGGPGASEGTIESSYTVESDFEIESARIESGRLDLTLVNRFPLGFDVAFAIPTYRREGAALVASANLGAGESSSIALDLSGAEIVPESGGGELVVHTTLVTEDLTGKTVTVDPGDEILVEVVQSEIDLATITGRMTAPFEIEADTVDTGLGDASLGFRFAEPSGTLTIDRLPTDLRNLDLAIVAPGGYPVLHLAGSIPATGGDLELDSVELEAFLAAAPGTAIREGSVEIGSGIVTLDRRDEIAGQLRITAPMKLIVEGRSDTLDVERVDDVDEDLREILLDRVESASMVLRVANGIPIGVSIDVGLDPDSSVSISNPVVTLPAGGPLEVGAPETDAEGLAEGPVVVVSRIEISQDDLDALFGTDRFFASTKVRLQSSEGREIWIRGTDPIEIAAHLEVTATVGTIR